MHVLPASNPRRIILIIMLLVAPYSAVSTVFQIRLHQLLLMACVFRLTAATRSKVAPLLSPQLVYRAQALFPLFTWPPVLPLATEYKQQLRQRQHQSPPDQTHPATAECH